LPFTQINGSTFPAPDPTLAGLTPPVSDPDYDTDIFTFIRAQAPDTFNGQPDLRIWGAPTSRPAADRKRRGADSTAKSRITSGRSYNASDARLSRIGAGRATC
jgi:hypothetical protein